MTGYLITATVIGVAFCLMAVWPSLRPRIQPTTADDRAWIDERIAAETDPGRRAAWRMIRDLPEENQ